MLISPIDPWKSHNEIAYQIWAQSNQWFVCKCAETTRQIRSQETVEIQRSVTNSKSGLKSGTMSSAIQFELNPISSLSVDAQNSSKASVTDERTNEPTRQYLYPHHLR